MKSKKNKSRNKWLSILILIIFLVALFLCRIPILHGLYNYLNVTEPIAEHYDYGIVLGGEPFGRPVMAAKLYKENRLDKIICTGAYIPAAVNALDIHLTEAEISQYRLVHLGVPKSKIIIISDATSTKEEVDDINKLFAGKKRTSLLIITSQTHTRRARRVFKKYLDPWEQLDIYGVLPERYEPEVWWTNEFGILAVFEEYLKTVFYWIKY